MRLFAGLDIDAGIRGRIERFMDGMQGFAPEARWVRPESLHVTLKFLGEQPEEALEKIRASLRAVKAPEFELAFRGFGFFPNAKAARVFWVGIEAGAELGALAGAIDRALAEIGVAREEHAYSPHLTLARGGRGSGAPLRARDDRGNSAFRALMEKLTAIDTPDFGRMTAREFFLYQSQLGPGGSRYTRIERFPLIATAGEAGEHGGTTGSPVS